MCCNNTPVCLRNNTGIRTCFHGCTESEVWIRSVEGLFRRCSEGVIKNMIESVDRVCWGCVQRIYWSSH